jgi:two-component system response regulator YesN
MRTPLQNRGVRILGACYTKQSLLISMTYNHRRLLEEMETLFSGTPSIRLSDIARTLNIDRHTIENAIRKNRRISFREYRRRKLLQMARSMLRQPNISIKEIGIRLGYASAASFSRFIQKSTGKSPSQLRKDE